ncbi:MAG: hypothetical protein LKJ25_03175 [Clostridia bacterium]|jgi:hypothetical protein|nr:hypothetical protein [Clostridia bacterium]
MSMKEKRFYLSQNRYREMKYFCLQYYEKKEKIKSLYPVKAVNMDGMPSANNVSNPTETYAEKIIELKADINAIEDSAKETSILFYKYIIENVTKNVPYEYLDIPMSRRSFYMMRKKFFYLLSKKVCTKVR